MPWLAVLILAWCAASLGTLLGLVAARGPRTIDDGDLDEQAAALARWAGR